MEPSARLGLRPLWQRALHDATWLTARRAVAYRRILAGLSVLAIAATIAMSHGGLMPNHQPLGTDFVSFWTASLLALQGHAAAVYRPAAHMAAEHALFPHMPATNYAFFYPPVFLALCLPLALLPYGISLILWLAATGAGYARVVMRLLARSGRVAPGALLTVLAYPAVLVDIGFGQNGLLSAALLGGFVLCLRRRPGWAGLWAGCLIYKPHLGLALPIVLLAGRHWRAFAAACAASAACIALSLLLFGAATWRAFLGIGRAARWALETGQMGFYKQVSVFAAVRQLGHGVIAAYGAQIVVALAVAAVVLVVVLARPRAEHGVLAVAAAPLLTPFALIYDLVILAVPLAWLWAEALRAGFLPYEKIILLIAYVTPLMLLLVGGHLGLPLGPVVALAVFALTVRRLWRADGPGGADAG